MRRPAFLTVNGFVRFGLEGNFTGFAAFGADSAEGCLLVERFKKVVVLEAWPSCFGVAQHFGIIFEPTHHVKEAFAAFFFPFSHGFVAEVTDLVEVGDFDEALGFAVDVDAFDAVFAVDFLQLLSGDVEDAALADVDFFVWFKVEA